MKKIVILLLLGLPCLSLFSQEDSTRIKVKPFYHNSDLRIQAPDMEKYLFDDTKLFNKRRNSLSLKAERSMPETSFNMRRLSVNAILPAAMIAYGVFSRHNGSLKRIDSSTADEVAEHMKVKIPIDDYTQYVPLVPVFALDLCGVKARHNLRDRALITAGSYAIMGIVVNTMKGTISAPRPDGSNDDSFPSGHTAMAFTGAHILFKEYHDTSIWIGVAGYGIAAATETLRVLNKKHWVSDVVTGAGIGILSAELGYRLLPVMHKALGIRQHSNLTLLPACSAKQVGVGISYTF